jgi:exodeoxyribonuclease VII small subunit
MTSAKKTTSPQPHSFEETLGELESIISLMEAGNMPLEDSLAAYKKGVALLRECQEVLNDAEQQIKILQNDSLQPFFPPALGDDQKD